MPRQKPPGIPDAPPYNPLDIESLALSIRVTLETQPTYPLGAISPFRGVGIYAIYYSGKFPAYEPLVTANQGRPIVPIYVGKAVSKGARKGAGVIDDPESNALSSRLRTHARSIRAVPSLSVDDFAIRFLRTMAVFAPLCESATIGLFKPTWNVVLDGFGNNPQGSGRDNQVRSEWDTLHPGRKAALKLGANPKKPKDLELAIKNHLRISLSDPGVRKQLGVD